MFIIFIPTILHIIITYVLGLFGVRLYSELIFFVYLGTSIVFLRNKKNIFILLLCGYILRILIMYFDIYFNDLFVLPHTGDSESFLNAGYIYYNSGSVFLTNIYGGLYSKFLGILMMLTGDNRLILQHINIIFDICSILILMRCFDILKISNKYRKIFIPIYIFMPMHMIVTSVLMRESIIIFFISLSLFNITCYYKYNKIKFLLKSIIYILAGSLFHSAVIFLIVGYFYMVLFYNNKLTVKNMLYTFIVIVVLITIIYLYRDILLRKILKDGEINITYGNYKGAGSLYLPKLRVNSIKDSLLYAPIRGLYFLISPTPLYWRGISDILSFLFDSVIYLVFVKESIKLIKYRNYIVKNKGIILSLLISIILFTLVFGLGVNNSGTAIRHRTKILTMIIVYLACIHDNWDIILQNQKNHRYGDNYERVSL